MTRPTFAELLEGAKVEASAGRGATNCTYILAAQDKAYPRTCQRCGLGPCPFSDRLMAARPQDELTTPDSKEAPERVTQTVIFFREGMFYLTYGRANEDWAEHARLNPGTLRIESIDGKVLWPEGTKQ